MRAEITEHGTVRLYPENGAEAHMLKQIAEARMELQLGSASYTTGPYIYHRLDYVDLAMRERKATAV